MIYITTWKKPNKGERKIAHKCGCIYIRRMLPINRIEIDSDRVPVHKYRECTYCGGIYGEFRVHKKMISKLESSNDISFIYDKNSNTLYIRTKKGFWKIFEKKSDGKYLLYHLNEFQSDMDLRAAMYGSFHRQQDVKETNNFVKLIDYIVAHDRAREIMEEDYRKLPHKTKQQKKYYKSARNRSRREASRRVEALLKEIEKEKSERAVSG